jgi:hypothetical protein
MMEEDDGVNRKPTSSASLNTATSSSYDASATAVAFETQSESQEEIPRPEAVLPADYEPRDHDVLCGRGKCQNLLYKRYVFDSRVL